MSDHYGAGYWSRWVTLRRTYRKESVTDVPLSPDVAGKETREWMPRLLAEAELFLISRDEPNVASAMIEVPPIIEVDPHKPWVPAHKSAANWELALQMAGAPPIDSAVHLEKAGEQ